MKYNKKRIHGHTIKRRNLTFQRCVVLNRKAVMFWDLAHFRSLETVAVSPGIKWLERDGDRSPPSWAEINNACSYTCTPTYVIKAWRLFTNRDKTEERRNQLHAAQSSFRSNNQLNFVPFIETECSLLCWKQPGTGPFTCYFPKMHISSVSS